MEGKSVSLRICSASQDAIECVIRFRTNNYTIKRGALSLSLSHALFPHDLIRATAVTTTVSAVAQLHRVTCG
jgi:hypothetical protein